MRLHIDVREGDWASVTHSPYGACYSRALDALISSGEFDAGAGAGRWLKLDRRARKGSFEIVVPDADVWGMTVHQLQSLCLSEARRLRVARPKQSEAVRTFRPLYRHGDVLQEWLADSATDEHLPGHLTLAEAGLTDGDLLALCIMHPAEASYMMAGPPNPAALLQWLQLAENANAPAGGPRLWGVLLYTDADVELATYVRTHFDDLNVLSGPATRVFVVERRTDWSTAKKYWRRHLEPELYRVMSTLRWLRWTPYDPQGAYEIASLLGLGPELLPCLVVFHSPQGPLHEGEKIVFRIEHTSTAYFRSLFGGIDRVLRPVTDSMRTPEAEEERRSLARYGPTSDYYTYHAAPFETEVHAPAPDALQNLLAPGRAADAAAFAAVREAEQAIKSALRSVVPSAAGLAVHNSQVVVVSRTSGAEVTENFYFQGENTTFINRPQDTVIRDFQNTYGTIQHADDLIRLLQLVLASRDMAAANRNAAASEIHDLARIGADPEPDLPAARTRIERLRALLSSGADIAQPALAILASLTAFFSG
ncbi:hypothetical protein GCM10010400_38480 [Streptomyces aculeolatus]|uniref:hypothetical protein n=1 Tax=Streptomyces aculeolatus TaxID=270689 RepID=UPI001CEC9ABC|nr:hypothetical protein [Streptomyces aculeolatus]